MPRFHTGQANPEVPSGDRLVVERALRGVHFCCLSVVLRHRHMCLQAKETPCTILYLIKGQKVDVGKGMIMDPLQPTFHNQPIPAGHFRVSLSSVKSGHEDLLPLV